MTCYFMTKEIFSLKLQMEKISHIIKLLPYLQVLLFRKIVLTQNDMYTREDAQEDFVKGKISN